MSGRPKMITYQYDSTGKYIRKYSSQNEVRKEYYSDIAGKMPFFRNDKDFHFLPNNTVLVKSRIGREKVKFAFKIKDNPLLNRNSSKYTDREIVVYDLLGNKVAEFKDIKSASVLMNMSTSRICNIVTKSKGKKARSNKLGIDIKFK